MDRHLEFETPENILVRYETAGLGARYVAWFIDMVLIWLSLLLIFLIAVFAGLSIRNLVQALTDLFGAPAAQGPSEELLYFLAVFFVLSSLAKIIYFGAMEWFMDGRTYGKRNQSLRVVMEGGFSLSAQSVLLRNLFRFVDHFPLFWLVPFFSKKAQRFGDMAAGTIVVRDRLESFSPIRQELAGVSQEDHLFRFDHKALAVLRLEDYDRIEKILTGLAKLNTMQADLILHKATNGIARRLMMDPPKRGERTRFLKDLMAAEYRRRTRNLG